jgi:ligand-binding SRPBCC domain-containing protein
MKIKLSTVVSGHYLEVMKRFDRDLFTALLPPVGKTEIVEFTGSETGDKVHLRFITPFKAEWISDITDHGQDEDHAWFVDEGRTLPFGLKYWRHKHIVKKVDDHTSEIIDDITFKASNTVFSMLMYPGLWLSFIPRKPIYRKYFQKIFG